MTKLEQSCMSYPMNSQQERGNCSTAEWHRIFSIATSFESKCFQLQQLNCRSNSISAVGFDQRPSLLLVANIQQSSSEIEPHEMNHESTMDVSVGAPRHVFKNYTYPHLLYMSRALCTCPSLAHTSSRERMRAVSQRPPPPCSRLKGGNMLPTVWISPTKNR